MTSRSAQPVSIVLERRAQPGAQESFDDWVREMIETAARFPRFEGSSVLTSDRGETFILFRFATQVDLDAWHASPEVTELLIEADMLIACREPSIVRSGLETWFRLPGHPAPPLSPPRWKMAVVTWLALLPFVIALPLLTPRWAPPAIAASVSTAIAVAALTWVVMPRLTIILYRWLYAPRRPDRLSRSPLAAQGETRGDGPPSDP